MGEYASRNQAMPPIVYVSVWRPKMKLEDFKRLHEAMEIPSHGTGPPFMDLLENMFDEIVRLERGATRSLSYDQQVGENGR